MAYSWPQISMFQVRFSYLHPSNTEGHCVLKNTQFLACYFIWSELRTAWLLPFAISRLGWLSTSVIKGGDFCFLHHFNWC